MRKNIQKVLAAFEAGIPHNEKTCSTDGTKLYSYRMLIAEKTPQGIRVVSLAESPSRTTSAQIRAAQEFLL